MADNYQLFSQVISELIPKERAWLKRMLECQQPAKLQAAGFDLQAIEPDDWPGIAWEFIDNQLWLHGDECGNVSHVAELVRAFLARFRPNQCWQLTWAETCSRPRIGEFSGGGVFVTATGVKFCIPHDWLRLQIKKFEQAANSDGLAKHL